MAPIRELRIPQLWSRHNLSQLSLPVSLGTLESKPSTPNNLGYLESGLRSLWSLKTRVQHRPPSPPSCLVKVASASILKSNIPELFSK